jgi:hypothetical protein
MQSVSGIAPSSFGMIAGYRAKAATRSVQVTKSRQTPHACIRYDDGPPATKQRQRVFNSVDLYKHPLEIGLFLLEAHGRARQKMAWSGAGRHTRFTQKVEMQGFAQREMTTIKRCGVS